MRTIWDLVSERAERIRQATAAVGERVYSYGDVTEWATELSESITKYTPEGSLVAIDTANPVNAAIAILAAARSGCAVLPLNRESPPAHRERVLADALPSVLIQAEDDGAFSLAETGLSQDPSPSPGRLAGIAYVMYTSGSTGLPKGVMVTHNALLGRLAGLAEVPGLGPGESILAMTALSFDISMAELLLPLTVGGKFIVAPREARTDPDIFAEMVDAHAPDVIQATPSFWRLATAGGWLGALGSRIWCGGEPLTPGLVSQLAGSCRELWNLYGPTEATIWVTAARIESPDAINLGAPLRGSGVMLEAPGVHGDAEEGEILLFGDGLAEGYLGQEELTSSRFHPHATPQGLQRVYRTGDRARRQPDGSLQFLGRHDDQVKLRGHRIELGEVESVLEEHPAVSEAAVVLRDRDRPERTYMEAFIVTMVRTEARELQRWLHDRLPASYCPAKISTLAALPRTTAGKVDRAALAS